MISQSNTKIAKNTFFLYARMIVVLLVSLYATRVLLNALGVIDYGVYNVVAGFVSMFAFINNTMSIGIMRFYNYEAGSDSGVSQSVVYTTAIQIQLLVAIIVFVLLETLGLWYINNIMVIPSDRIRAANIVFQCSAMSLIFVIMQIPFSGLIMARERFDFYALTSLLEAFLKLAVVIAIPYVTIDKLSFYGSLSLVISISLFLIYYTYTKKVFRDVKFLFEFQIYKFKQMLSFSAWNIVDMLSFTLKGQGVNMLLNAFFGPVVNAARAVSAQVSGALSGFSSNIVTAFRPQLVESYAQQNTGRTCDLMIMESKISYSMFYALALPITLEINYILALWLGNDIPENTSIFTILVLAICTISTLNTPLSQVAQAVGDIKVYNVVRGLLISSVVPIAWIALRLGATAVVVFWISLIITTLNQPVSVWLLHRIFPFSYVDYLRNVIIPCLLFSILTPIIPLLIQVILPESFIRLLLTCIVSVTISLLSFYFVILKKKERSLVIQYLGRATKRLLR